VPHALFCVCFLDWLLNQHHFPAAQNVPVKQSIFADLEKACRKDAILSTNTSTINIELVGKKTKVR